LKEHREEELARGLLCHQPLLNGNINLITGYGSVSDTTTSAPGEIAIRVPAKGGDERVDDESHGDGQEEGTPLMEYKRRQRTSPTMSKSTPLEIISPMRRDACNPGSLTGVPYPPIGI